MDFDLVQKKVMETLRFVPDFPKKGINFADITPLF